MEESKKEKEIIEQKKTEYQTKIKTVQEILTKDEKVSDMSSLKKSLKELEEEANQLAKVEQELKKKEKLQPWNVDTISQPGFAKTVINTEKPKKKYENMSQDEKEKHMKVFMKENEDLMKKFGMLRKYDDSKAFLQTHHHLVCEDTANFLVIWCINLQIEKKSELMAHVAHQSICMQYILELSKQLDVDPRACVNSFFTRIQVAEQEYRKQFDSEVAAFKERIEKRAQVEIDRAAAELEEEERLERLGPGGLDPVEIFPTLPAELQACFESRDIELLQTVIAKMPEDEAKYHMKRCVDSGLWVPDAKAAGLLAAGDDTTTGDGGDDDDEEIYDEVVPTKKDSDEATETATAENSGETKQ